ncbi:hypothetical protein DL766_001453 [Monosporascus sp. MC13-8B]|uniref:Uncharacterized protein n=1 Tax=Monosporascus cannonballus TaxID=155416 RepID=A0ABY0HG41_9PEZI|nr:hypothetical protein DL762_003089 [Monosporascus cannonballus]RYP00454.1 hypothetical protein DL763_000806 [Monosporascus cannonballus]RYP37637.1 hypothetical protein DL766_001453 [Monosporascus sp. MC13-8B]
MPHQSWLITGASSGLGAALALEVLWSSVGTAKTKTKVVGTTRDVARAKRAQPDFEARGGVWLEVDVARPDAEPKIRQAVEEHGIDVLVNCAGFALLGALEDISDEEIHDQMETNFVGPLRCIRAALPSFRARSGSGTPTTIVNVSSASGFIARPGRSLYCASKFALEGATEALAHEVRPFGIRVLLVEPGAFRTPFADTCVVAARGLAGDGDGMVSAPYRGTPVDDLVRATRDMGAHGGLRGDPAKAARRIAEVVGGTGMAAGLDLAEGKGEVPFRLLLGPDCARVFVGKLDALRRNYDVVEAMAMSTDLDSTLLWISLAPSFEQKKMRATAILLLAAAAWAAATRTTFRAARQPTIPQLKGPCAALAANNATYRIRSSEGTYGYISGGRQEVYSIVFRDPAETPAGALEARVRVDADCALRAPEVPWSPGLRYGALEPHLSEGWRPAHPLAVYRPGASMNDEYPATCTVGAASRRVGCSVRDQSALLLYDQQLPTMYIASEVLPGYRPATFTLVR